MKKQWLSVSFQIRKTRLQGSFLCLLQKKILFGGGGECRALETTRWGVAVSPGVKSGFNVASWPLLSAVNQPSFGISRERVTPNVLSLKIKKTHHFFMNVETPLDHIPSMKYNGLTQKPYHTLYFKCLEAILPFPQQKHSGMANSGCQLDTAKQRVPQLKNCLHQIGLWVCLWGIFLIAN